VDAASTAALAVPPGRIGDLVTAWCARAADGDAGELRLFVRDGGIAVEETYRRPRALLTGRKTQLAPGANAIRPLDDDDDDDDDEEPPDYVAAGLQPRLEGTEELELLMRQPPGPTRGGLRLANPNEWRSDLLDGRGSGGRGRPKRQ